MYNLPFLRIDFSPIFDLRAWTYDGHVAFEDVEKLGEFVEFGFAQEVAKRGDAGAVASIETTSGGFFENAHGAEFVEKENSTELTYPLLPEKNWTRHGYQYDQAND